jgi:hypothetical protein
MHYPRCMGRWILILLGPNRSLGAILEEEGIGPSSSDEERIASKKGERN